MSWNAGADGSTWLADAGGDSMAWHMRQPLSRASCAGGVSAPALERHHPASTRMSTHRAPLLRMVGSAKGHVAFTMPPGARDRVDFGQPHTVPGRTRRAARVRQG